MTVLPAAFTARMRQSLGDDADAFFAALKEPPVRGLRVNPLKKPAVALQQAIDGLMDAVPWASDGFYLSPASGAGAHPLHAGGAYYLQEASAMLPAALLAPMPGETVLDLCAAPGGKSTQMAAMMRGQGTLVCNEPVPSRAAVLSGNLERMGVSNAAVVSADPSQLADRWPQLFNAILVDAPCSGEGMFRRHPEACVQWDDGTPAHCAGRQLRILESAARMLKPGGRLCYSTCTFSQAENEAVVGAFLASHPAFSPVDFQVPGGGSLSLQSQNGCLRLYPHIVQGEGHFAALMVKAGAASAEPPPAALLAAERVFAPVQKEALPLLCGLWEELAAPSPPIANAIIGNLLVSAPPLPPLHGLKCYRAGLALARVKGKVCIPDHALALAAPPFPLRSVALDDEQVRLYLQGEVLPVGSIERGFWTVTYQGLPLGFVKHSNGHLKNHYPKGLRKR